MFDVWWNEFATTGVLESIAPFREESIEGDVQLNTQNLSDEQVCITTHTYNYVLLFFYYTHIAIYTSRHTHITTYASLSLLTIH